mgnify:CR=1 FL=1
MTERRDPARRLEPGDGLGSYTIVEQIGVGGYGYVYRARDARLGRDVAVAGLREGISAQGKTLPVSQLGKWKAAAEMAGVGAFLAYQAAALLAGVFDLPISVVLGLDWAARLLLWSAAVLALISGAQYLGALLKRAD